MSFRERYLDPLLAAVAFLTRIPVPDRAADGALLSAATAWFSLVGWLVGILAALPFLWLPPWYASWVSLLITICLTGALHEDGLADTCDGVFGGRDPESRRAIMRDSRIGAYGAIGLWLLLNARFLILRDLAVAVPSGFPWLLAVAAAFSRTAAVIHLALDKPTVDPNAKSSCLFGNVRLPQALFCLIVALTIAVIILRSLVPVLLCVGITATGAGVLGLYLRSKLEHLTGDALGAIIAVVEIACLAGMLAISYQG